MKNLLYLILVFTISVNAQNREAPSWVDFTEKKANDDMRNSILLDYSYAGYRYSEKEIPDVSGWNRISVIDYGATPDDNSYDDAGIQAAINAAEALNQPTVVYFPAGKYNISSEATFDTPIDVSGSNIVLKGAGSGSGGTEIFADKHGDISKRWNTQFKLRFIPERTGGETLTNISARINRGDQVIQVADASSLSVGMAIAIVQNNALKNFEVNMPNLEVPDKWTKVINDGMRINERHEIAAINGNKVTLKSPVRGIVTADLSTATVRRFRSIEEVGIEDILFTSGWGSWPEVYVHHANDLVDYGWRAVEFKGVRHGWIRNVVFKDWIEDLKMTQSMNITAKDITIEGKQGHSSYYGFESTNILFENCVDLVPTGFNNAGGQGHGPGVQVRSSGCVFLNCKMQKHQSADFHGDIPYSNLMDNIDGGCFFRNGGAERAYPHSGQDLTFWNFYHTSNYQDRTYNFWRTEGRGQHNFARPNFVGFRTAPGENIKFSKTGLNELRDRVAYPQSLFDAQLQLRLYNGYISASSEKSSGLAKYANDNNEETAWESNASGGEQWILLDLGIAKAVRNVVLNEKFERINEWKLEYWDESEWKMMQTGNEIGAERQITFNSIDTRKLRFTVLSKRSGNENNSIALSAFKVNQETLSLGDDKIVTTNSIKVYPNPSTGVFSLNIPFNINEVSIDIYNLQAQVLSSKTYSVQSGNVDLNMEEKPNGVYFIKVHMEKPVFIKLIKQ